jgi:hypothetical protein
MVTELEDAERLLVEAVAVLQEEDRPRAVELDEDGGHYEHGGKQEQCDRCKQEIERPLLDQLQARQRHARELQARHRAEPRELHVLEAIENVLRSEMDFPPEA